MCVCSVGALFAIFRPRAACRSFIFYPSLTWKGCWQFFNWCICLDYCACVMCLIWMCQWLLLRPPRW